METERGPAKNRLHPAVIVAIVLAVGFGFACVVCVPIALSFLLPYWSSGTRVEFDVECEIKLLQLGAYAGAYAARHGEFPRGVSGFQRLIDEAGGVNIHNIVCPADPSVDPSTAAASAANSSYVFSDWKVTATDEGAILLYEIRSHPNGLHRVLSTDMSVQSLSGRDLQAALKEQEQRFSGR